MVKNWDFALWIDGKEIDARRGFLRGIVDTLGLEGWPISVRTMWDAMEQAPGE